MFGNVTSVFVQFFAKPSHTPIPPLPSNIQTYDWDIPATAEILNYLNKNLNNPDALIELVVSAGLLICLSNWSSNGL